ncbi:hypothetical protein QQ045_005662 [Rhodiola kirilowii]
MVLIVSSDQKLITRRPKSSDLQSSDEALAAFVETCGYSLDELLLNNIIELTDVFFDGHSNPNVQVIGRKMTPILKHIEAPNPLQGPLRYSPVVV